MEKIVVISTHAGAGKTTITVNLAAGLAQKGYNVLIWDQGKNDFLYKWLRINKQDLEQKKLYTQKSHTGIDVLIGDISIDSFSKADLFKIFNNYYYILLDIDDKPGYLNLAIELADYIIACTDLLPADEPELLATLDNKIQKLSGKELGINLIVPCKVNAKEWDNNTQRLFTIADRMGYEKIADLIPACEAIHDLPLEGRTVWDLPGQYQNRKDAFNRLVERVDQDLKTL